MAMARDTTRHVWAIVTNDALAQNNSVDVFGYPKHCS
jgi:hypothetical protein